MSHHARKTSADLQTFTDIYILGWYGQERRRVDGLPEIEGMFYRTRFTKFLHSLRSAGNRCTSPLRMEAGASENFVLSNMATLTLEFHVSCPHSLFPFQVIYIYNVLNGKLCIEFC